MTIGYKTKKVTQNQEMSKKWSKNPKTFLNKDSEYKKIVWKV